MRRTQMLPFPHESGKKLSDLSTFGIGGPARFFAQATTKEEMQTMLAYCMQASLPFFILGKGSNCLFDDRGYAGLVILNKMDYLRQHENIFTVGSGYSFARLGSVTARNGWTGLEFASGIPATVGGAIFMNAGANKKETGDCLIDVEYIDERGECRRFKRSEITCAYRFSSFQQMKGVITEGVFALAFSEDAKKSQKEILNYRLKTQPYGDKSAGCAFRNPIQSAAGHLIERCGLKGLKVGGAKVSELHGNFIVNQGGATAHDVQALMQMIKEKVLLETGVVLEEEIRLIPYES